MHINITPHIAERLSIIGKATQQTPQVVVRELVTNYLQLLERIDPSGQAVASGSLPAHRPGLFHSALLAMTRALPLRSIDRGPRSTLDIKFPADFEQRLTAFTTTIGWTVPPQFVEDLTRGYIKQLDDTNAWEEMARILT